MDHHVLRDCNELSLSVNGRIHIKENEILCLAPSGGVANAVFYCYNKQSQMRCEWRPNFVGKVTLLHFVVMLSLSESSEWKST